MPQLTPPDGLYGALEDALKKSDEALDCTALFGLPEIRRHAKSVNRVSDYLGNMWRKGDVIRLPAPPSKGIKSRWVYAWKGRVESRIKIKDIAKNAEFSAGKVGTLLSRPSLEITEEGKNIVITTPHCTITIKPN